VLLIKFVFNSFPLKLQNVLSLSLNIILLRVGRTRILFILYKHCTFVLQDDVREAYQLIKDLEPAVPQEYILKGVVNAALGQENGSVCLQA
jgi:hypothetical protein